MRVCGRCEYFADDDPELCPGCGQATWLIYQPTETDRVRMWHPDPGPDDASAVSSTGCLRSR
jgi:hypothetical protein